MSRQPAWMPTPEQELLLGACLHDETRARRAFQAWRAHANLDRLDAGSDRLLPLLWTRISTLGIDDPARNLLKGLYRRTWFANQTLLARAAELASTLTAAGVPTMVVKGLALMLQDYGDMGARPMRDIDLAVPRAFARRAVEVLTQSGWRAGTTPLTATIADHSSPAAAWTTGRRPVDAFDDAYFGVRHAHSFEGDGGAQADLHWFLFQGDCEPGVDDAVWAAAIPARLRHVDVLAANAADHLLLVLTHAARWNPVSPVRWVADAVTMIRRSESLNWGDVASGARARHQTLAVFEMLTYLERHFAVGVPPEILDDLRSFPVSRRRQRAYRVRVSSHGIAAGVDELRYLLARHRALRRGDGAADGVPRFGRFVSHVIGARHLGQVGLYAASEVARRMTRHVTATFCRSLRPAPPPPARNSTRGL